MEAEFAELAARLDKERSAAKQRSERETAELEANAALVAELDASLRERQAKTSLALQQLSEDETLHDLRTTLNLEIEACGRAEARASLAQQELESLEARRADVDSWRERCGTLDAELRRLEDEAAQDSDDERSIDELERELETVHEQTRARREELRQALDVGRASAEDVDRLAAEVERVTTETERTADDERAIAREEGKARAANDELESQLFRLSAVQRDLEAQINAARLDAPKTLADIEALETQLSELRGALVAEYDDEDDVEESCWAPLQRKVDAAFQETRALEQEAHDLRERAAATSRRELEIEEYASTTSLLDVECEALRERVKDAKKRTSLAASQREAQRRERARFDDQKSAAESLARREAEILKRETAKLEALRRTVDVETRRAATAKNAARRARAKLATFIPREDNPVVEEAREQADVLEEAMDEWRKARRRPAVTPPPPRAAKIATLEKELRDETRATERAVKTLEVEKRDRKAELARLRALFAQAVAAAPQEPTRPVKDEEPLREAAEVVDATVALNELDAKTMERLKKATASVVADETLLIEKRVSLEAKIAATETELAKCKKVDAYQATKVAYLNWLRESRRALLH